MPRSDPGAQVFYLRVPIEEESGKTGQRENETPAVRFLVWSLSHLPAFPLSLLLVVAFLASTAANARINVVTLPGRDSVQLTIYNSVDLTLVKETRLLTFRKGLNRLEFSWANTLIDPTSVEFRALTHADAVEVLDASFPPRVTNTLEWRINSDFAGEVRVEIRYFTSGISWSADYVAEVNKPEKSMGLAGYVRVNNNSGEDYEDAQVRLVVGVIRLVEEIAQLARMAVKDQAKMPMTIMLAAEPQKRAQFYFGLGAAAAVADEKKKEIVKEGLSEYFLYTVEGRDTIPNGWSKRLPSFQAAEVPITSYYKYERERWNHQVIRNYRFKNDQLSKLGNEPLPDGDVKAFRLMTDDQLYSFVGRTSVKYIPVDEQVDLELGNDLEVMIKPTLMNWVKTDFQFDDQGKVKGWTVRETWEFELQNSKDIDVQVDIRRTFKGDWSLATDAKYEKMDATKVKFVVSLKPREKQKFIYELTTRHGTNITK
jgi:hypothetical protein